MEPNNKSPQSASPGLKPGPSNSFAMTNQISNPNHLGKVSLLGVDSPWGDCTFIPSDWGVIVVYLCYFAPFEDFSL